MKLLEEESDNPEFPPEDVNVNSTSIEKISNPVPPSRKGKGTPKFSLGTIEYNVCDLQSEDSILSISLQRSEVVLETCNNIVHNKTIFKIPVTLWVYSKKVQTEALVDLGATMNFIDRVVMENNNLATHKLANLYHVINADGTPNKAGQITEYVSV